MGIPINVFRTNSSRLRAKAFRRMDNRTNIHSNSLIPVLWLHSSDVFWLHRFYEQECCQFTKTFDIIGTKPTSEHGIYLNNLYLVAFSQMECSTMRRDHRLSISDLAWGQDLMNTYTFTNNHRSPGRAMIDASLIAYLMLLLSSIIKQ